MIQRLSKQTVLNKPYAAAAFRGRCVGVFARASFDSIPMLPLKRASPESGSIDEYLRVPRFRSAACAASGMPAASV
jgi:hypothetical protein